MSEGARSSATSYEVDIGGTVLTQTTKDGLEMLVFEDHVDMVNMLTVKVGGAETQPAWTFAIGDAVTAKLADVEVFSGEIVALEPGFQIEGVASITMRCMDKSHRLGRGRKTRFWEDLKDSDVAQEVGGECGLSVEADATGDNQPYILQRNESNIAFLKRLAARNNFQVRVKDDKLIFVKASFQGTAIDVEMGENLRSIRFSYNSMDQVQQVVVRGWDPATKEEVVGTATSSDVTKIGGGELGVELASQFGDSTAYITDVPVSSQAIANEVAKAEMERLARQFCRGTCSIQGNVAVRAGGMLKLGGLADGLNGNVYVLATRHMISRRSGYSTEITFCSNTQGT
jgi:phage protein D